MSMQAPAPAEDSGAEVELGEHWVGRERKLSQLPKMEASSLKTLQGETVGKHMDGYLDETNNGEGGRTRKPHKPRQSLSNGFLPLGFSQHHL